jgi:hypothetical protein
MTDSIEAEYRGTVRGLERIMLGTSEGARQFVVESTAQVTRDAQENANTGAHGRGQGHLSGTGPGPNVVSGTLRRSIKPTIAQRTPLGWSGTAGPSVGYARAIELGNPNWASGVKFPYLAPAIKTWKAGARELMTAIMGRAIHD